MIVLIAVALGTNFMLYSNSVINNLKPNVQPWVKASFTSHYDTELTASQLHWLWALSTAALHLGALVGSMFTNILAESPQFGRRRGLMVVGGTSILGGILSGVCKTSESFELFAGARFILGIALGAGKTVLFQQREPYSFSVVAMWLRRLHMAKGPLWC